MMEDEFNSLQYTHTYIPKLCPEPFGWGEVNCCHELLLDVVLTSVLPRDYLGNKGQLRKFQAQQLFYTAQPSVHFSTFHSCCW